MNKSSSKSEKSLNVINDTSPIVSQRSKIKQPLKIYERKLTEKQKEFLDIALDKTTQLMFVTGPAGTSKTYLAVLVALTLLNLRRVSDLIYIRSAVESSDAKLGFLPGEANEKMAPYIAPLLDKLMELLPKNDIDYLQKDERISATHVGFLRGLNWNAKVIIGDEAQNMTEKELLTMITRIGQYSKMIVLGDPDQADINGKSGFIKTIGYYDDEESRQNGIRVFRFTDDDIVRSGLVQFIMKKRRKPL